MVEFRWGEAATLLIKIHHQITHFISQSILHLPTSWEIPPLVAEAPPPAAEAPSSKKTPNPKSRWQTISKIYMILQLLNMHYNCKYN